MNSNTFDSNENPKGLLNIVLHPLTLIILFCGWLLIAVAIAQADDRVLIGDTASAISFVNANPDDIEEGRRIAAVVSRLFEQITLHRVGSRSIYVCFSNSMAFGEMSLSGEGRVQGTTVHQANCSTIQISNSRTSSWGRVFAHELTHVFVREAYGRSLNRTLNEGLAEYIAAMLFSSEVRRDLRNATRGPTAAALRPYVEGFRFIAEHVADERLPAFLESEMKTGDGSYRSLREAWDRSAMFQVANLISN
ncbi:MAG: hypothetical protein HY360_11550 [Verrucomicrobia bacterium]|nr:hypothetical protein [Verrucomicrobiota bacterium]